MENGNTRVEPTTAVTMFADIIGCSVFSNTLSCADYDGIVACFQEVASRVLARVYDVATASQHGYTCDIGLRGDEVCLIMYQDADQGADGASRERRDRTTDMARLVVRAALDLKRAWILSEKNRTRIQDEQREPIGLGIGINCGSVTVRDHTRFSPGEGKFVQRRAPEGYSINLAKRIEGESRKGRYSRIFVGQEIYNRIVDELQLSFDDCHAVDLKGFIEPVPVYEIKSAGHVEDGDLILRLDRLYPSDMDEKTKQKREERDISTLRGAVLNNPRNFWIILDLAHYYFDKEEYDSASDLYRKAIALNRTFAPAHMYLGRCYYRCFDDVASEVHLRRAVQENPESARSNNFLGVCLRRRALRAKAIGIGETNDDKREAHMVEARRLLEEALECHERAVRLGSTPGGSFLWASIARAHTLAEMSALSGCEGSDVKRHHPHLVDELKEVLEEVAKRRAQYTDSHIHGAGADSKQSYLIDHTIGFVYHELAAGREGVEQGECMETAIGFYRTAISGLSKLFDDGRLGGMKFHEKRAEIERHWGSALRRLGKHMEAKEHYGLALDSLWELQQIRAEQISKSGRDADNCRMTPDQTTFCSHYDTANCSHTCLPCWWISTRGYWERQCGGGPWTHCAEKRQPEAETALPGGGRQQEG